MKFRSGFVSNSSSSSYIILYSKKLDSAEEVVATIKEDMDIPIIIISDTLSSGYEAVELTTKMKLLILWYEDRFIKHEVIGFCDYFMKLGEKEDEKELPLQSYQIEIDREAIASSVWNDEDDLFIERFLLNKSPSSLYVQSDVNIEKGDNNAKVITYDREVSINEIDEDFIKNNDVWLIVREDVEDFLTYPSPLVFYKLHNYISNNDNNYHLLYGLKVIENPFGKEDIKDKNFLTSQTVILREEYDNEELEEYLSCRWF